MKLSEDWRLIQWRAVKAVANNDVSRVIGLVPLAGYLILFNDEIASLTSFDTIAGVVGGSKNPFFLDAVTKLRLVFFGSLFVFFSHVIYRVYGPLVLDVSNDEIDFSTKVRESFTVGEIARMEAQVFERTWTSRRPDFWSIKDRVRTGPKLAGFRSDVRSGMLNAHGDYISHLAREWWAGTMHTNRPARLAAITLGLVGYVFLAMPALDISQAVLRDMLSNF
ncbi:hypothetical protein G5V65_21235 [Rhodobacter sp. HX-7-19]|uniref:Uncharacterized protein n=1 Tax=Paragemmobacter kunshanensis TaxID=2583234 RepID=A0A6M1UBQ2_9RHOB|nr:hypothetical protein [Rhodobacter kunshanensis]NGQ93411.1 hypothetical protein [Rhodobacter kunshanensis]